MEVVHYTHVGSNDLRVVLPVRLGGRGDDGEWLLELLVRIAFSRVCQRESERQRWRDGDARLGDVREEDTSSVTSGPVKKVGGGGSVEKVVGESPGPKVTW